MGIFIKTDEQVELIRIAGKIVADTLLVLEKEIRPGISTREINDIAEEFIRSKGAVPSFLGYNGFPAAICTSVNEEVIHGIPGLRKLREGDIISIDIGAYINGFHGDAARTYPVGIISDEAQLLIDTTKEAFFEAIQYAKHKRHLHEISAVIQSYAEARGFSLVREYCGHGIGRQMHEDPQIPNHKVPSRGPRLAKGMVLAVEPMVNAGTQDIQVLHDTWTVVTRDRKYSAHYENTFLVTDGQPDLLTLF